MKLSKLTLNTGCEQARKDLGSPHNMHRTIMRAFPSPLPDEERVLFRAENTGDPGPPVVLVQSFTRPEWVNVEKMYEDYFACSPEVKSLDGLHINSGDMLRFRLRANPCKRVFYKNTGKRQRISLFSEEDRRDWLVRKAKNCGFSVIEERLLLRDAPYRTVFISKDEKTHKATFNMVDYDGLLSVVDPEKFLKCVCRGIGPAKGLGCGLLSFSRG